MLQELAELGMAAAKVAKQRIVEQAERERGMAPDPTGALDQIAKSFQLDFARAAQAVRQTLALQEKIEQDHRARIDREAAAAAARTAEAAQRRAAARRDKIARRKALIGQELGRVIRAKAAPRNVHTLIDNLNARLRPERLDSDFGDVPLREIFLRICRSLGVPEEWARQWDDEPDPEDAKPANAPAPIPAAAPANDAESCAAEAPCPRQQTSPRPPGATPERHSAAAVPAPGLGTTGTGPPRASE